MYCAMFLNKVDKTILEIRYPTNYHLTIILQTHYSLNDFRPGHL